jgi:glycosyltransferase involved in cell wall biosynthesis
MNKPIVTVIFPDSVSKPTGGLGVQFKNLYSRLKDKIDFQVVGHPDGPNNVDKYKGVPHPIPAIQHGSLNTLIGHTEYLKEALKYPKPDIVHAYDWSTYYAGVCLAELYNVPLLVTMQLSSNALASCGIHNCIDISSIDGLWLHKTHVELEMYGLRKATKIIHVSQGYSRYFSQFQDKSTVIPNGIHLNDWIPNKLIQLPGDRKYKVVYIGRFSLMKSVIELVEADIPKDIDLIFIGVPNGGDQDSIVKLEEALSIKEGIHYYGPAYDQHKINILFSSDAVIMPSKHEPFGIVALEALASRNILLSSRVDGLGDFCTDSNSIDTGFTPESISKALHKFTQMTDEEKINMVTNGLATCLQYQWDDIANQYYEAYTSLL